MLHLVQVKDVADGYNVVAILDHNEDHANPPAHIKFKYDVNAKMISFEYVVGYVNPNPSAFNKLPAVFEMIDLNQKKFKLLLTLDGNFIESGFLN
jgi:hypothetical protein